ncbi:metal-sensing transcriptional repressor [Bacillus sp. P2(2020)]|uniref:Metal-sensing transcriptional repressor n=2 Tax=Calidifontibacillus erzurumensis TaxID=2741433 RepID=A0A8J8KDS7_9BACI|nr:metal-sensing transcriptional repressor [Calidifontibacillus erzurumensis]
MHENCSNETMQHQYRETNRSENEKKRLLNRLKRIEGQVRGVQKMIEENRYCIDVLVQISAINAALKKVGLTMLEQHTHHCVADAIQNGNGKESIEELMKVIEQFTKS